MEAKVLHISERDHSIELLESIAILLVLISHGTCYAFNFIESNSILNYGRYLFRSIIPVSIPIFFFCNGYLLLNKKFNLRKHIFRIIRLIVLTFIWGFITVLLYTLILNQPLSLTDVLLKVWRFEDGWTNHLWFMGALVCIYIFFPLLKIAWDNNKNVFLFFTVIVFIMTIGNIMLNESATLFYSLVLHKPTNIGGYNFFIKFNPFRFIREYYALFYFCFGGYAFLFKDKILKVRALKRNITAVLVLVVSLLCLTFVNIVYSFNDGQVREIVWNSFDSIFTCLSCISLWILCLNFTKSIPLLQDISSNTLGIYFIHPIINKIALSFILTFPKICTVWFNVTYAILLLFICLGLTCIIKRIPILKKLV